MKYLRQPVWILLIILGILFLSSTILALTDNSIENFRAALNSNNVKEFKRAVAPGSLTLIRLFNQNRGQDLIYRTAEIPGNFQINVPSGMPFDLKYLFGGTLRARELVSLETDIAGLSFSESIPAVRQFCQKVLNYVSQKNRGYTPTIVIVSGNCLVLTEAKADGGMLSGSMAVFMGSRNNYTLRAIIDMR